MVDSTKVLCTLEEIGKNFLLAKLNQNLTTVVAIVVWKRDDRCSILASRFPSKDKSHFVLVGKCLIHSKNQTEEEYRM